MPFRDYTTTCRFTAAAGGLADFVVAAAVVGFKTPQEANARDANVYHYVAQSADGETWEEGLGAWSEADAEISRDTIIQNSNGSADKISFPAAPVVVLFPSPLPLETIGYLLYAPTGTAMVFYQAAAPVGWTKQTAQNDKALRVVSGVGGVAGGNVPFSTLFGRTATDSHTLTINEMPEHDHGYLDRYLDAGGNEAPGNTNKDLADHPRTTEKTGGGQGHSHNIDLRVHYLDVLICTKDAE